ncbi:unnamed protein product [Diamesa hyperborea]
MNRERCNFRCGWPHVGVPALEPFFIENIAANIDYGVIIRTINIDVRDALVHGNENFIINDINFSLSTLRVDFDLSFPQIRINAQHTTQAVIVTERLPLAVSGAGAMNMITNNVRVTGVAQIRIVAGFLHLADLNIELSVGSIVSDLQGFPGLTGRTLNRAIESQGPIMLAENQELINNEVRRIGLPLANSVLNRMTLTDLINLLANSAQENTERWCFPANPLPQCA